jgi:hypothetical protein
LIFLHSNDAKIRRPAGGVCAEDVRKVLVLIRKIVLYGLILGGGLVAVATSVSAAECHWNPGS